MQFNTISIKKQDADKVIAAQKLFFNSQNQSRIGDLVAQELYVKQNKPLLEKLETISSALSTVKSTTQNVERQKQQQEKTELIKQILSMLGSTEGLEIFEEKISSPFFDKQSSYIDDTYDAVINLYDSYKASMKTTPTPTPSAPTSAKKGRKPVKKQTIQEIRKLANYQNVSNNELNTLTAERLSSLRRKLEAAPTITPETFRQLYLEERDAMKITRKLPEAPSGTPRTRELEKRVEELGTEETKQEPVSGDGIGQMMLDLASLQAGNNSPVVIKRAITALYNNKMIKKRVMNRLMKEYLK